MFTEKDVEKIVVKKTNAEKIIYEMLQYMSQKNIQEFYDRYISVDVVIINDFQFTENFSALKEEFEKFIKYFLGNGKRVVLDT